MAYDTNVGSKPEIECKVLQDLGTAIENDGYEIKVQLIKWGNNPEKYDIRKWKTDGSGRPKKGGITLTGEEIEALTDLLIEIKNA